MLTRPEGDTALLDQDGRLVALDPVPAWLERMCAEPVRAARSWADGPVTYIHASTARGSHTYALGTRRGQSLMCLVRASEGWRPVPTFAALPEAARAEAHAHAQRMRWLWRSFGHVGDVAAYDATPLETRYAAAAACLHGGRVEEVEATLLDETPTLGALALAREIVALRWEAVLPRLAAMPRPLPAWLEPLAAVLSGDVTRAQRLAADANGRSELCSANSIAATVYSDLGFAPAAIASFERALPKLSRVQRASTCSEIADLHRASGRDEDAVTWARRALLTSPADDRLLVRVADQLVRCGAYDDAYEALRERAGRAPVEVRVVRALSELSLWAGRAEEARRWLTPLGPPESSDDAALVRAWGIVAALEGRNDDAIALFERALVLCDGDALASVWLAELLVRRDDREAAARHLARSRARAQGPVHVVLSTVLHKWSFFERNHEMRSLLEVLEEPTAPWTGGKDAVERAALALLARFGGNRTPEITVLSPGTGGLGLRTLRLPVSDAALSARNASAENVRRVVTEPFAEVERRFAALAEQYPTSPHPYCYWGEVVLWQGEYERAIELFLRGKAREAARWTYVGRAAALFLLGRDAEAEAILAECARAMETVIGATTHVYVGEALRRKGDLVGARAHLEQAVEAKPGRVASWMNLALVLRASGQPAEALRIFRTLERRHPRLYWDAWHAVSGRWEWPVPPERLPDVYEAALRMMRGNRSSHTITYFGEDGSLRLVTDAEHLAARLRENVALVARDLREELASGAIAKRGE